LGVANRKKTRRLTKQKGTYFSLYIYITRFFRYIFIIPEFQIFYRWIFRKKIQEASSSQVIRVNTMEMNKNYPIVSAERITTKFGPTVLMHIKEQPSKVVKVYLPKRYSAFVSDEDIELINLNKISLNLVYKGTCDKLLHFSYRIM